jgi:hypothetical protein
MQEAILLLTLQIIHRVTTTERLQVQNESDIILAEWTDWLVLKIEPTSHFI